MLKIDRGQFVEKMRECGIGCSVHFIPLHLHPFYKRTYGYKSGDFPIASAAYNRILSLPIYPKLSDDEVFYVVDAVKKIIDENKK
jgi:dTDP-4-amino-4,6-dideoxygalactose transaminase